MRFKSYETNPEKLFLQVSYVLLITYLSTHDGELIFLGTSLRKKFRGRIESRSSRCEITFENWLCS